MKLAHQPPKQRGPLGKRALGAYLLVDDLAHATISKAADALEKRTSWTRSGMAETSIMGGYAIMLAQDWRKPDVTTWIITAMLPVFHYFYKNLVDEAGRKLSADGVESSTQAFLKKARLPLLATGTIIQSSLFIGIGVGFYLLSATNGLLDRITESVKAYLAKPSEQ